LCHTGPLHAHTAVSPTPPTPHHTRCTPPRPHPLPTTPHLTHLPSPPHPITYPFLGHTAHTRTHTLPTHTPIRLDELPAHGACNTLYRAQLFPPPHARTPRGPCTAACNYYSLPAAAALLPPTRCLLHRTCRHRLLTCRAATPGCLVYRTTNCYLRLPAASHCLPTYVHATFTPTCQYRPARFAPTRTSWCVLLQLVPMP